MKRNPFSGSLRYEVDRLFDHLVHTAWGGATAVACRCPSVDIIEDPDRYRVEVDLPGVRIEDLTISAEGGVLRIEGSRKRHPPVPHGRILLAELRYGRFARSLRLPVDADVASMQARFNDGVLTVDLPRRYLGDMR